MPEYNFNQYYMRTFFIDWSGPFKDEEIQTRSLRKELEWFEFAENGLYILIGKRKGEHKCRIQYVGITQLTFAQRFNNHIKKGEVTKELDIWIGKLVFQNEALNSELQLVEHALLSLSDGFPLNERKVYVTPPQSCTIISRFWNRDGTPISNTEPCFETLPSVLVWDAYEKLLHYSYQLTLWQPEG